MSISQEDMGEKNSVWQIVADILMKYGSLKVYPPATHKGKATDNKAWIVLKEDGAATVPGYSSMYRYFRIMIYAPRNEYSKLDEYEAEVREIIEQHIFPLLLPTGSQESDYYDDNYDAHMRALLYRNVFRNKLV